ncbi:hypothetical protein [Stutzerimonas frequens]|uniref:hypothetical protein n=1 Tax=Stutzerimonas frequens TaxID=2968969 RepID=UPI003749737A
MGRWLQKIQNRGEAEPTKPTKHASVGFVGTPCLPFQQKQLANNSMTPQQLGWLAAVASLLEVCTLHLIEGGFIDQHDLEEQLDATPRQVAALIRSNPNWYRHMPDKPIPHSEMVTLNGNETCN